jgi:hypothetical protein
MIVKISAGDASTGIYGLSESDSAGDLIEHALDTDSQRGDGQQANDGDESNHQAVLNHRGPVFVNEAITN